MNKPPDETLKQGRNRSWLLVKNISDMTISIVYFQISTDYFSSLFLHIQLLDYAVNSRTKRVLSL